MIDQGVALEHIRSSLQTATGRPVFLATVPERPEMPYAVIYSLPFAIRAEAFLARDPGPWRVEIQATSVGRTTQDASWLLSKVDDALSAMAPPPGAADTVSNCTVSGFSSVGIWPMVGTESMGIITMNQRWRVSA